MFKDYDKYLSASLKVYLFVLVIVFIMKLVGLDYFGLDESNKMLNSVNFFFNKHKLTFIFYFINLSIYQYLMTSIMCNDNSNKFKKFTLMTLPFTALLQYYKYLHINNPLIYILEFLYLFAICKIYNKKVKTKRIISTLIIIFILQLISNIVRGQNKIIYENDFIRNTIMNIDYFIMLIMYYEISLKGGITCQDQVGSYLLKKMNLKNLLKRLQANLHNFKKQTKENKIAIIIYLVLSLIWNIFTIFVVLLIATLNHTFIECIFILTSFWLSKRVFGKAFHLSSMAHCFIVSNLTYYILNRITTPLGISIFIPIALGVGLSYVTSKFVKKAYKPLYKGMPEKLFEETILKIVDKDSKKYKICYDFYILNQSDLSLSFKYNYSVAGIRKIKDRINVKIKEFS